MATITKETVVLGSPKDWEAWILIVKALAADSWPYIDPSSATVTTLDVPEQPRPSDFGGTNTSNIDPDQRAHWIEFNNLYHRSLKDYERKKARIDKAEEYIITHIDKSYLFQKANYDTLRDFLVSLKKALAPSDSTREQMIVDRYLTAKEFPSGNTNFETWQQEYLVAYLRAKEAKIPDVSGDRAHWDLVKAIVQLDSGYAAIVSMQITSQPRVLPSIEDTLSAFTQHYRRTHIKRPDILQGTYAATIQGQESPYKKKRQSRCPCGDFHVWGSCPELVEDMRPQDFTPDARKQENIRAFCKDPERKKLVTEIRLKARRFRQRGKKRQYRNHEDQFHFEAPRDLPDPDSDYIEIDAGDEPS
jgi:hypothetical protein